MILSTGCGGDDSGGEADARTDAPRVDAAETDAAETDAPTIDAPSIDAPTDATPDAGVDAPTDAMPTSSESIGFVRAATGTVNLPVGNVTVTYLKPAVGSDPAGFTVQAVTNGPAVFIAVNPANLTPVPVVGDVVSFTVTSVLNDASTGMQPRATAITGFTRVSQGADVNALVQNVTAATDLVTMRTNYDSELIDISGTIAGAFGTGVGGGFEAAQVTTTGLPTASASFLLRVPTTLRDATDMAMNCNFTLNNVPFGFFTTTAQLAAFVAADVTLTSCPAPTVMTALALSPTQVRVTFSRNIAPGSVMTDGSQFMIDGGVTVSAAAVSGRNVTLTTSAQAGNTLYTVTITNTLTDLLGTALVAPFTTMFSGFVTPAVLKINEINANIAGACDLIELRVVSGGNMNGFKVQERTGVNAGTVSELNFTFTNLNVATNAIIVVHINGTNATCNPGTAVNETTSPTQQLAATFTRNYDTAYDWYASDNQLTSTDNVITLYDATGAIMDCVLIDDDNDPPSGQTSNVAAASETQAAACVTASQWQNVGGGTPSGGYIDESFRQNAVLESDITGTANTGTTHQRLDNTDENDEADWNSGAGTAHTWGLINAGQSAL